ncbi:MAG: hypothetical protein WC897_00430 [Candidatus Gracilibacteria bacterium]
MGFESHVPQEAPTKDERKEALNKLKQEIAPLDPESFGTVEKAHEEVGKVAIDLIKYLDEAAGKSDKWYEKHHKTRVARRTLYTSAESISAKYTVTINDPEQAEQSVETWDLTYVYTKDGELNSLMAKYSTENLPIGNEWLFWQKNDPVITNPQPGSDGFDALNGARNAIKACKESIGEK